MHIVDLLQIVATCAVVVGGCATYLFLSVCLSVCWRPPLNSKCNLGLPAETYQLIHIAHCPGRHVKDAN